MVISAAAATNEYYSVPAAKKVVDNFITALGGEKKLNAVERVKLQMEMTHSASDVKIEATIHQTRSTMRRTRRIGDKWDAQLFDGTNAFLLSPTGIAKGSAKLRDELMREIAEGPGQSAMLGKFLNKTNHLRYAGEMRRAGETYHAIETLDAEGDKVLHYIDPKTHREIFRFKFKKAGQEVQSFDSFEEFGGILYPTRITMKLPDGATMTAKLLEVSHNFDDSIFRAEK